MDGSPAVVLGQWMDRDTPSTINTIAMSFMSGDVRAGPANLEGAGCSKVGVGTTVMRGGARDRRQGT